MQCQLTVFLIKNINSCPISTGPIKKFVSVFHISPLQRLKDCYKVSLDVFFSKLNKLNYLSLSS